MLVERNKFVFAADKKKAPVVNQQKPWKILIVDDEEEVHAITRSVLKDVVFENRALEILSAYSGQEGRQVLQATPDISLILLDVVMEEDHAGLHLVKFIREELGNNAVRIVLRTGQPGSAPEKRIIIDYDINDYKEKTELTSKKLFTAVIAALRASRDIQVIEQSRSGLEKIIEASKHLFGVRSMKLFTEGVLTQLSSILHMDNNALYLQVNRGSAQQRYEILAATGAYQAMSPAEVLSPAVVQLLERALERKSSFCDGDVHIGYFATKSGNEHILVVHGCNQLTKIGVKLLEVFSANVAIAFENISLNQEIIDTQKEIVSTLGEVVESRSKEVANHVTRVANLSYLLAISSGLDEETAQLLRNASPMHDVGKVAIPDEVLLKPARLTEEEFDLIKSHTAIGYNILRGSKHEIIKAAATIAHEHHERYDGTGYPRRLAGEEAHIFARITAIADVFDALLSKRTYKDAWSFDDAVALVKAESGKQFDPSLVDAFLGNLDKIREIYAQTA